MKMNGAPGTEVSGAPTRDVTRMRRFLVVAFSDGPLSSCYAQSFMSESQYETLKEKAEVFIGTALIHDVLDNNPGPNAIWTGLSEWVDMPVEL